MLARNKDGHLTSITLEEYRETLIQQIDRDKQGSLGFKIKTLPIIRHIRYIYNSLMLNLHFRRCFAMGLGIAISQHDEIYLDLIWEGYA